MKVCEILKKFERSSYGSITFKIDELECSDEIPEYFEFENSKFFLLRQDEEFDLWSNENNKLLGNWLTLTYEMKSKIRYKQHIKIMYKNL